MDARFDFSLTHTSRVVMQRGAEALLPDVLSSLSPHGVVVVHDAALAAVAARVGAALGATEVIAIPGDEAAKHGRRVDQ